MAASKCSDVLFLDFTSDSCLSDECRREMIIQHVDSVTDFSSQYGSENSLSYSASNLVGEPSLNKYGDSPWSFVLRTFGTWWERAPSASRQFKEQSHHKYSSQDFVYPIKLRIYESYNPGSVIKIMAYSYKTLRWTTLWCAEQLELDLPSKLRTFSPPIKNVDFITDLIRLEFHHCHLNYYGELDAVELIGSLEPSPPPRILSPSTLMTYHSPRHHLNEVSGLNVVCSRIESLSFTVRPSVKLSTLINDSTNCHSYLEIPSKNHFESLPSEVIHLIVSHLDLSSLCRLACTCRLMKKQCYDRLLYSELDLKPYWHKVSEDTLSGLKDRCVSVKKLRLSWSGSQGRLCSSSVTNFVNACGSHLTCVHLGNCHFVDNDLLTALAECAPQLEELDLQCCQQASLDHKGFMQITKFTNLRRLNLYRTLIELVPVLVVIKCCHKLEFLNLGSCSAVNIFDEVAFEISRNCRCLKSLNLWRAKTLTAFGVNLIADNCNALEELDLGWCVEVYSNTGCISHLAEKCPRLRRICLTALRTICDNDVLALATNCIHLEQLDILGTPEVSSTSCRRLLFNCKNLCYLDVSCCQQIDLLTVQLWRQDFTNIFIAKSE